jgi:hypothetical protein
MTAAPEPHQQSASPEADYGDAVTSTDDHMLADLRLQAESMTGLGALPRAEDGEPLFDQPWQGRAVAMAVETVAKLGISWDHFREKLIAAIDLDPVRNYYESWLVALEQLVADHQLASDDQIDDERMVAASYRTTEQNHDDLEVFPIPFAPNTLLDVLTLLFEEHWQHILFGPLIQGAVFELAATQKPRLTMLDGYLTIDLGGPHIHLCIDEHRGQPGQPVEPKLAYRRRCAQAELQRLWIDGAPRTWMFRMFNGDGDQMITVLLPNPFLSDDQQLLHGPDWTRLTLWDQLRWEFLSLPPDAADRLGEGFVHP